MVQQPTAARVMQTHTARCNLDRCYHKRVCRFLELMKFRLRIPENSSHVW